MMNSVKPSANAASVFALSNSWSPISRTTIWTVTAVTDSKGLNVRFAATPAAITTIIVSPMALDNASKIALTIPGRAAGKITSLTVSDWVEPKAADPSLKLWGTALITSSDSDDILFILNHTGEPCYQNKEYIEHWEQNMKKIAACENFVTKISGLGMFNPNWTIDSTKIFVEKTIEIFGIERCMFASNFPVDKIFNTFDNYWNSFKAITKDYSENDKTMLFSSNAEKYYRI